MAPRPQFPPRTHRAREQLDRWSSEHPGVGALVDELRIARRSEWPDYVYLPLERAGEVLLQHMLATGKLHGPKGEPIVRPGDVVGPASHLTLFAAWRLTQGIYRYDPALYGALTATPITGEIPGTLLRRLPQWCIYVETPDLMTPLVGGGETRLHGVWAWLDWVRGEDRDVLTLGLDADAHLAIGHIPLVGTLDQALDQVQRDWDSAVERGNAIGRTPGDYATAARKAFAPILSLLLYLCADEPDLDGRPANPQPRRTRHGWRLFPADRLTTWHVGVRLGAALRAAYARAEIAERETLEGGRARPRAHIRSAHWHTYHVGEGRTDRRLKWLPPIPVNLDDAGELPATIRGVKK